MTFESFSLDQRILAGVRAAGYTTPTPIQERAIPSVLAGRDVMGLAQTGTGKTAAFVLPILQRMLAANFSGRGPVRVLVLAPTRELALQIHETFVDLGRQTGMRSVAVFGGVGMHPQIKALRQSSVVVACPGRLIDLLNQGAADLSQVNTLVLDEADRMLDMGFMPDLRRIMAKLPRERQNLLFSATMPTEIRSLCANLLHEPTVVQVANTAPAESVSHALYPVEAHRKSALLEAILREDEHESVLVFTRTKHRAKNLAQQLSRKGFDTTFLQGNLSQSRRQEALEGFRCGKYRVMVATDIAARGIDCARISHVINFDLPDTAENYTHRIGRTGRADRSGVAITLVTGEDAQQVRMIERTLGQSIARRQLAGFDYDAPAPAGARAESRSDGRSAGRPGGRFGGRGNGRGNDRDNGRENGRDGRGRSDGKPQGAKPQGNAAKPASDGRSGRSGRGGPRRPRQPDAR
ncbi:DEAD/DEAH box helicase domain protein [Desulfovibrio sp. X2]|uniref:DEAD/DEAH box helicase n=1 Tax=Desulfovibrio sp. X2 TaxID=941449 RepID=UPI0003588ED0|nr:DEAD/DEAH box helicase [Desulfovibrio sp. X2]EPR41602.1 DEAD/DEAH box helicase domain protein [Desulfovibrio sp. X2]